MTRPLWEKFELVIGRQNYSALTLLGGLHKLVGPRTKWEIGDKPTPIVQRAQALINKELNIA